MLSENNMYQTDLNHQTKGSRGVGIFAHFFFFVGGKEIQVRNHMYIYVYIYIYIYVLFHNPPPSLVSECHFKFGGGIPEKIPCFLLVLGYINNFERRRRDFRQF